MGANLNVKKWSRGFTSRQVEIIELESGEVLKNVAKEGKTIIRTATVPSHFVRGFVRL